MLVNLFDALVERLVLLAMDNADWRKGGLD